jgi:hypothetical protein
MSSPRKRLQRRAALAAAWPRADAADFIMQFRKLFDIIVACTIRVLFRLSEPPDVEAPLAI